MSLLLLAFAATTHLATLPLSAPLAERPRSQLCGTNRTCSRNPRSRHIGGLSSPLRRQVRPVSFRPRNSGTDLFAP